MIFQIKQIDHVVLRVSDLPKMVAFYTEVLGCTIEREVAAMGLYQLRAGEALLDLVTVEGAIGQKGGRAPEQEGHNMDHFCLRIEPFDETAIRQHLASFELEAGPVESRYGAEGQGPSIYINDPESNVVELKGPPFF